MTSNNDDILKYGHFNGNGVYIHDSFDESNIKTISHSICNVAINGLGLCNIGIIDQDRGIPRFHIFTNDNNDISIRLDIPEYYNTYIILSNLQKDDINNIMKMESIFGKLLVYDDLCSLWNDQNNTNIKFIKPDYRLIKDE